MHIERRGRGTSLTWPDVLHQLDPLSTHSEAESQLVSLYDYASLDQTLTWGGKGKPSKSSPTAAGEQKVLAVHRTCAFSVQI